ncbi:hypothetical protein ACWFRT_05370 [Streptomyces anulatus]
MLLREYGYTHRSLPDKVNRTSGRIFGRPGAATDRDVRRWISTTVRWPTHLTASTAATLTLALRIEATPVRGRLTMTDADRITTTIGRLDAYFTAIGGGALLTVATAYIADCAKPPTAAPTTPGWSR